MLCKDVMFFDENMNMMEKPDFEKCSEFDFDNMYYDAHYIFIDGKKALKELQSVYAKFVSSTDEDVPFTKTGAYVQTGIGFRKWEHLVTKISNLSIIKNQIQASYIQHSRLPLQGGEEL